MVPLMHIRPSHVVSVSLGHGFRMSLQPEATDRVRALREVTSAHPVVPSDDEGLAVFDAIGLEDRRIVESIARVPKSGHFRPGRLRPGEMTLRRLT